MITVQGEGVSHQDSGRRKDFPLLMMLWPLPAHGSSYLPHSMCHLSEGWMGPDAGRHVQGEHCHLKKNSQNEVSTVSGYFGRG